MNARLTLRSLALAATIALVASSPSRAADIRVDAATGDDARDGASWATAVRTIGRALVLAQAAPGADTVHVATGTYAENVLVARGEITLLGGYPSGGGTRDPAALPTVVDGGGAGPALAVSGGSGRIVLDGVTIDGFTFRNGAALGRAGIYGAGAGIFVEEAAVVLTNNVIESNVVRGDGLLGAGLYVYRALAGPSRIERNILRNNRAENGLGGAAAILDFGDPALGPIGFNSNQVTGNQSVALAGADPQLALAQGGGLFLWGGAPVVASNRFESNVADSQIDADYSGQGGGVFVLDAAPVLSNNVMVSNTARASMAPFGGAGGAVYAWWGTSDTSGGAMVAAGNQFEGNRAEGGTGPAQAAGGAVAIAALGPAAPVLSDNTFTGNVATGLGTYAGAGGALFAYVTDQEAAASLRIDGGTVSGNAALDGGGGLWLQGGRPGAIVADGLLVDSNEADYGSGILVFGDAAVRNSRVRGNRIHDPDGDQVSEVQDNCRGLSNPVQSDADTDGLGDACDADDDGDGVADAADNCPLVANPSQGAACAGDADGDGVGDGTDNCPLVANPGQADATLNGVGDACEPAAFDALETNASGIWVTGDATLTNVEIVRNIGQGLLLIGTPADPAAGQPEDSAAVTMSNLTIAENRAAGFITYLADGSSIRDTIVARNDLSDGFDTERPSGGPSSPNVTCNSVYFYDGVASLPCTGNGNMDWVDGPPLFVTGSFGDHYLAQAAAGQAADFVGVNAGSRSAASSPVAGLTTRTDAIADSGTVDLGYHYDMPSATFDDVLAVALRATRRPGGVSLSLTGVPTAITAVRWFRGRIDLLPTQYSHASPFTGLVGNPECSAPPALPVEDPNAIGDGQAYYYLAVDVSSGVEGTFGRNSLLTLRTRPEDSPTDLVTTCP